MWKNPYFCKNMSVWRRWKSPRHVFTSPSWPLREKSSLPIICKCSEPCFMFEFVWISRIKPHHTTEILSEGLFNGKCFSYMTTRTSYIWPLLHAYLLTFIVLAHWNENLWADMWLQSDILSRFRANQSLLLHINAACFKQRNSK